MMKKIALLLVAMLLLSSVGMVSFAEMKEGEVLLSRGYETTETGCTISKADASYETKVNSDGSAWWAPDGSVYYGGSYASVWLVKHPADSVKQGQYMAARPRGGDDGVVFFADSAFKTTSSFKMDFSFMNASKSPEDHGSGESAFGIYIYPETKKTDGRSQEGHIATVYVGEKITVIDDTTEKEITTFETALDTWYDVSIVVDQSKEIPTYTMLMKQSADDEYSVIASDVSFPKDADYSKGLGTFGTFVIWANNNHNYSRYETMGFDDFKITEMVQNIPPSVSAVFASGSGKVGESLQGLYQYSGSPKEGTSSLQWLVCDTEGGKFEPIEGATTDILSVGNSLKGKYVKFMVTPVNTEGEDGEPGYSPAVKIIESEKLYGVDNLNNLSGELKVAFIGGSITYGTGASTSARRYSTQIINNFFKKKFPSKEVIEINSGIGGTPSDLGLMRLNREISSQAPDVVFVEYAVNDKYFDKATTQRQYEGIVRQLLKLPKQPVIIPLYTCENGLSEVTADYQEEVAQYYGLGSISFIKYVKENGGENTWKGMTADGTHPSDAGHAKYSEIAIDAFNEAYHNYFKIYEVPAKIMSDHEFVKTQLVPYHEKDRVTYEGDWFAETSNVSKDSFSGYHHWGNGTMTSTTVGDKVTFTFKGSTIGLWAERGTKQGKATYSIDNGKYTGEINANSVYPMGYPIFFRHDLEEGDHTITIENKGGGTENRFAIGYFFTDNDYELKSNAENVTITGSLELGKTLSAKFDYDGDESDCSYQWLYSDNENGPFTKIKNATGKSWKSTTTYANKYVRVEVTAKNGNSSQSTSIQLPGTAESVVYQQTYEEMKLGESLTSASNGYSSWFYNLAGSYANAYLLNDNYSVNGNYLMFTSVNGTEMLMLTINPSYGKEGVLNFNRSFKAEFSFNNFVGRTDKYDNTAGAKMTVCMWPATLATDGRDQAARTVGQLVKVVPGTSISVYDNGQEVKLDEKYVPTQMEWYDMQIDTHLELGEEAPTYDVYLKKSADKEYTLIAENISYPKDYSYAGGVSTFGFLASTQQYGLMAYDNVKLYYPPLQAAAPTAENMHIEADKMATDELVTAKYDFVDSNSDEENLDATEFIWYRGNTADGEDFEVIEGATSNTYKLTKADENKYLKFAVNPKSMVEPVGDEWFPMETGIAGAFAPTADNIRLKEGAVVGRTVQAEFDYADLNGDNPGTHKYQWYVADSATGTPEKITGETSDSIKIKPEYKYLFLEVIPVSEEKPYDGKALMSDAFAVSSDNSAPLAENVKIEGNNVVGVPVTGTFKFSDPDGDTKGECIYQWYICDTEEGEYSPIENQETDTLYLNETYQNMYIIFGVIPVDSAGMKGKEVLSDPILVEGKLPNELFVSVDGNDENDGSLEHPFKTLEAARDAIRQMKKEGSLPAGGMTVYLRGGEYKMSEAFALTSEDSGTEDCPITYRNYHDEKVTLSGKQDIDFSKFGAITDETMKNKLRSETARSKVLVADLADIGLEDFEPIKKTGQSGTTEPLVFFDGNVCKVARYPNTNTSAEWPKCWYSTKDAKYKGTQEGYWSREDKGIPGTFFIVKYEDPVLDGWSHNSEQWIMFSYLKYFWAPETTNVTIDKTNKFIKATMQTVYGVEDGTEGRPFQMLNVYEELDEAGEWYVDTVQKKMYIYPFNNNPDDFYMATLGGAIISVKDAENLTFRGLDVRGGMGSGLSVNNSKNVVFDQLEISGFAGQAMRMVGGENSGIKNSYIHHMGAGGIQMNENGDIPTMTKSNNFVRNCEIHDFQLINTSYTAAVYIGNGVGNIISHNKIYNSEHCAIRFEGPFNIIEYNEFFDCVKTATDMAAVYTGRNIRTVGNEIRYNYFHNIGGNDGDHGTQAIFFDDGTSGNEVHGNVFGEHCGNTYAIKNYGGFQGYYYNNLFINNPVIAQNGTWPYWKSSALGPDMQVTLPDGTRIIDLPNYQEMFPWMKKLSDNSFNDADYKAGANMLENNLFFGIDTLLADEYLLKRYGDQYYPFISKNNQVFNGNTADNKAYFEDYDKGNYTLTEEAYTKIRAKIPEFKEIPFLWMGREAIVNEKPFVQNATLNGTLTLSVTYDYQDAERDLEGDTKFAWFWSDSKDGNYTKIDGAEGSLYQVDEQYIGKYVKAEITPVDEFGVAGTTVSTDAVFIVAGVDSLQALVDNIQKEVNNAKAGKELGQYPADAIKDMKEAVKAAKAVLDGTDTDTSVVNAAKALDAAYETFKGQQQTTLKTDVTDGTITIPSDLRKLDLNLGEVTGTIAIDGAKTLPETTVTATINGAEVVAKFPAGSKAGNIIEALNKPTAEVVGNHYVSAKFGVEGEAYKPEIEITVQGGGELTLYSIKDGVATNLNGENADGDKVFTLTEGSEILLTRLKVADTDATLKSVTINGKKIGGFKPEKINYILTYDQSVTEVVVEAEATSPDAKVEIVQAEAIPGKAIITVTAQDKSVEPKVYTFAFQYEKVTTETDKPAETPPAISGPGGGGSTVGVGGGIAGSGSSQSGNTETKSFVDIIGHWAEKDIKEMANKGVVSGVTDTTFEPDRSITRAEFAAIMVRALKLSVANTNSVFRDVTADKWYADEVAAAAAAGLIVGYDGQFRPEDTITREEMAVIVMKAYVFAGKEVFNGSLDKFSDKEKISDWAKEYVDQAVSAGLISGMTDGTFAPKENATRAQVASITKRLLDK